MNEVRDARFAQPVDAIRIIARADEPRTLLTPDQIRDARARLAEGIPLDDVCVDLAIDKIVEHEDMFG